jgi:IclR family transcriptional regulator, acetate operon repressor
LRRPSTAAAARERRAAPAATARAGTKKTADRNTQVQSLVRALAILNRLAESDDGTTLTDVAQQVGLSPSTAHRLLTTLEQERYVRFDGERRLWSVGVQAFVAGSAFVRSRNVVAMARPHMRALMEESGETVNLAVEDKGEAIYLAQVECRQMMRALATPGARVPLHCSSVGKALLSSLPEAQLSKILHRHGLPRLTLKTIHAPAALRDDLVRIRERGYAIDDEEHAVGLRCVAAVVFDEFEEPVAALSISGPMARITDERLTLLGNLVKRSAEAITGEIGGGPPKRRAA